MTPTTPNGRELLGHLPAYLSSDPIWERTILAIEAEAVVADRARLAAAVRGLRWHPHAESGAPGSTWVDRAAVLALLVGRRRG